MILLSGNRDIGLLLLRVSSGLLMFFINGLPKIESFDKRLHSFADPFGFGMETTFIFAVVSEGICTLLVALGLYTRIAVVPIMITMATAALVIHADDPWGRKELPLLFFFVFTTILITGPGKYSLDQRLFGR